MPLRRFICHMLLCLNLALAASQAQAMALDAGNWNMAQPAAQNMHEPCHSDMEMDHGKEGHAGDCCLNFACCLGLTAESEPLRHAPTPTVHAAELGRSLDPVFYRPPSPPPKSA